jgi:glyoxylase-like metal-dependent hydrolase (beta-lactamase superfamily II)
MSDLLLANRAAANDRRSAAPPTQAANATVHRISRLGIVNAYLIVEDDGLTLIDTGLPGTQRRILDGARTLALPIVRIALTHAHSDHVGSLDALTAVLPGVEVIVSEREAPLLNGNKELRDGEPLDRVRGRFRGATTSPTRTVYDRDFVGSLRVIATPGHTPGHVAFIDTREGTLYSGDVFTNKGSVATSAVVRWNFPIAGLATWSRELELDSARLLRDLDPTRLAPGHGPVLVGPGQPMQRAITAAEKRL